MRSIAIYHQLQEVALHDGEGWPEGATLTIGRNEHMHQSFPNSLTLAEHHLSVRKLQGNFYIRDEQTSSGSFIDGHPIMHAVQLRSGACYQFGEMSLFLEGSPATPGDDSINCDSVFPEAYGFALPELAAPAYEEQAPVYEEQAPVYEEQAPVYEEQAPVYEEQAPVYEEQAPVYEEQAPVYKDPSAKASTDPRRNLRQKAKRKTMKAIAPGCIRPLLPIAGAPATGIPKDFELKVDTSTGSREIMEGDNLTLRVYASERCQLVIICKEADDTIYMLYPNKQQPASPIKPNTWTLIPEEEGARYEFVIEGPCGHDEIQVIARKLGQRASLRGATQEMIAEIKKNEKVFWSHTTLHLEVIPYEDDDE